MTAKAPTQLPDDIEQKLLDGQRLRATWDLMERRGVTLNEARELVPGSPVGAMVCITRMRAPEFQIWWNESRWELQIASLALDARLLQFHCPADVVPDLSARERECLLWLASGLRTDRIAHRMGISSSAVDLYLANARRKLGARTRDQALLKAVLLGMLTP